MPHWNGIVDCQVLVIEPNQRLSYSWNASGEEAKGGLKTIVTWTLTPTKGGVLVRIEQLASSLKTRPTIRAQTMAGSGTSADWNGWPRGSAENEAGGGSAGSCHQARARFAGGACVSLIRARGAHPAQPITLARSPHTARKTPKPSLRTSARRTTVRRFVRCDLNSD